MEINIAKNEIKKYFYILSHFFTKNYNIVNTKKGELSSEYFEITFDLNDKDKENVFLNINNTQYKISMSQFTSIVERAISSKDLNNLNLFHFLFSSLSSEMTKLLNKKYVNNDKYVMLSSLINDADIVIRNADGKPLCGLKNVKRNNSRPLLVSYNTLEIFLSLEGLKNSSNFFALRDDYEEIIKSKNVLILQVHNAHENNNVFNLYIGKLSSELGKDNFWLIRYNGMNKEDNVQIIKPFTEKKDIESIFLLLCNIYKNQYQKNNMFNNIKQEANRDNKGGAFVFTSNPYEGIKDIFNNK